MNGFLAFKNHFRKKYFFRKSFSKKIFFLQRIYVAEEVILFILIMFLFLVSDISLLNEFLVGGAADETTTEVITLNYPQTTPAASGGYTTSAGVPPQAATSSSAMLVHGPSQGPYAAVNPANANSVLMPDEWSLESYNALHALIAPLNAKRNLGRVQKIREALTLGNIYTITNVFTASMYRGIGDVEIVKMRDACNMNATEISVHTCAYFRHLYKVAGVESTTTPERLHLLRNLQLRYEGIETGEYLFKAIPKSRPQQIVYPAPAQSPAAAVVPAPGRSQSGSPRVKGGSSTRKPYERK